MSQLAQSGFVTSERRVAEPGVWYNFSMRNYASKSNKRVVRYRTPSSFKTRRAEAVKHQPPERLPYHPPGRGQRGQPTV
ncbi:MAG: hypothetical protein Q8P77_00775 [Candidatus Veblenbacteria bacterium]|nr:hypothetical protein [Candidatus Veblenbacteria bacterium]